MPNIGDSMMDNVLLVNLHNSSPHRPYLRWSWDHHKMPNYMQMEGLLVPWMFKAVSCVWLFQEPLAVFKIWWHFIDQTSTSITAVAAAAVSFYEGILSILNAHSYVCMWKQAFPPLCFFLEPLTDCFLYSWWYASNSSSSWSSSGIVTEVFPYQIMNL